MLLHVYGIQRNSSVDGPGLRYCVFVQGCPRSCPGCHNPESQSMYSDAGDMFDIDEIITEIIADPLITGVSFSGGEPFLYPGICASIIDAVKKERSDLNFWAWSGYTYEEIVKDDEKRLLLDDIDVLVDGPFVSDLKDDDILWRGSSNQRIIDVKETFERGSVVVIPDSFWYVPDKTPPIKLHN